MSSRRADNRRRSSFDLLASTARLIQWPALPSPAAAGELALQFQLEHSQWWDAEEIRRHQVRQLSLLVGYATRQVPHYAEGYPAAAGDGFDWQHFQALPILRRAAVQELGQRLWSRQVPPRHGEVRMVRSSGSTGRPVSIRKTHLCNFFWKAFALRASLWQGRDFSGKAALIRYTSNPRAVPPDGVTSPTWGPGTKDVIATGPMALLHSSTDVAEQAAWLARVAPQYLTSYPSNLLQLARHCIAEGIEVPGLRQVSTLGEALPVGVRDACRQAWGAELHDTYSSEETGFIATQCPHYEHYHVQSEGVVVEVLDEQDRPCAPGETGRVVVTPLHNFATPLIRYDIGDYAQVGEPCDCGRGLPVLTRIVGRMRNLARLPDGRVFRPSVGITDFEAVAPVRQAQLVQTAPDSIELRLLVDEALGESQEKALADIVRRNFDYPMQVSFAYPERLERSARDKFEDFLCQVPEPG